MEKTITLIKNELAVLRFLVNSDQNEELITECQGDNSKEELKQMGLPAYPVEVFKYLRAKL